jgi:hypothetical protein
MPVVLLLLPSQQQQQHQQGDSCVDVVGFNTAPILSPPLSRQYLPRRTPFSPLLLRSNDDKDKEQECGET